MDVDRCSRNSVVRPSLVFEIEYYRFHMFVNDFENTLTKAPDKGK